MKPYSFALLLFISAGLHPATAQDVQVVKFDAIQSLLSSDGDEIRVINFWATWCAPCIKEMPYFEEVLQEHEDAIDLYFISLDYADDISKVTAFAQKKSLEGKILILDELDYNAWIDRVESSWSGAIPATLFINPASGERLFVESPLTKKEIESHINAVQ